MAMHNVAQFDMSKFSLASAPIEDLRRELAAIETQAAKETPQEEAFIDALAGFVRSCYGVASDHKRAMGIDDAIHRGKLAVAREYHAEDAALLGDTGSKAVYVGITNQKCRALTSWVRDILVNAEQKPWTIKPTPIPDMPEKLREVVIERLMQEFAEYGVEFDPHKRAAELVSMAADKAQAVAAEKMARMEDRIQDQLVEGGWYGAFDDFILDLAMYPSAVIKGPITEVKSKMSWVKNKLVVKKTKGRTVKRVDPDCIFPSPNSTDTQNGTYMIERLRPSQDTLMAYAHVEGFNKQAIQQAILQYPSGYRPSMFTTTSNDALDKVDSQASSPDHTYEVYAYYGRIRVQDLQAFDKAMDQNPLDYAEAEVWVTCGRVIKATLNPHPLGMRPFHTASFQKVAGSFWGQSLPTLMADVQRVSNATARALVRNMAYASGPIVEADVGRMEGGQRPDEVQPYKIYYTTTDKFAGGNTQAIRFSIVPSIANDLTKLLAEKEKEADNISGIPAYALGTPQSSGAGRTLGGLSLLMGNAAKGVKQVVYNIDRGVIEPLITAMYVDEMLNGEDESCKGDAQVVAQGSTGILQKELHQNQITELLQILAQYSGTGAVDNNAISLLLREFLRARGYNPDDYVKDPNKARQLAQQANVPPQQQGAAPQQQMPPQVPPKALARRKKGTTNGPQLLLDNTPAPPVLGRQSIARPGPDIQARVPANA